MVTASGVKSNLKILTLLSVLTAIFISAGYYLGGAGGMIIGLAFAGLMNLGSYWFSDKVVLKIYGAKPLPESEHQEIYEAVRRLSENAGIPEPDLYYSSMEAPNAFATGRSPKKGVVCLTKGLMEQLEQDEIEGVIAHELAHIKNRDTLVNAVVATIAGAISILAEMAFWGALFSGREENGEAFSAIAFMILTPVIALLIRTAVSRTMEFRADSHAVQFHGSKQSLSSALKKINQANKDYKPSRRANKVQEVGSNLFIENPFSSDKLTRFFSTHPPLEARLENIQNTKA